MKKLLTSIIVVALVLTAALTVFAACGDKTDYEHTIVFYSSQGQKLDAITQTAIDQFQAKYPGWKVIHSRIGGYDDVKDKVVSDIGANQQPDLAYCYPDHVATYLKSGTVVNISELINSDAKVAGKEVTWDDEANGGDGAYVVGGDKEYAVGYTKDEMKDFIANFLEEGYAENYPEYDRFGFEDKDLITLPFAKSTDLMYYNADALIAAGFKNADGTAHPAETWDELWAQCKVLKEKFSDCTPFAFDSEANLFITMCEQNGWGYTASMGTENYLFYNQAAAKWLDDLKTYKDQGLFTTKQMIGGAYTSTLFQLGVGKLNGVDTDETGVVYCIGSSGGASNQYSKSKKWTVGIAGIPGSVVGKDSEGNDVVNDACISQGPSLVMLAGGNKVKNVEEKKIMTFLFVKELLDIDFQATYCKESGYNPARQSVLTQKDYAKFLSGTSSTALAANVATSLSSKFFVSPAFDGSSKARTQVGNALVLAATGQKTGQIALMDAYSNCTGSDPSSYPAK